jgi:hypothetical protein
MIRRSVLSENGVLHQEFSRSEHTMSAKLSASRSAASDVANL